MGYHHKAEEALVLHMAGCNPENQAIEAMLKKLAAAALELASDQTRTEVSELSRCVYFLKSQNASLRAKIAKPNRSRFSRLFILWGREYGWRKAITD